LHGALDGQYFDTAPDEDELLDELELLEELELLLEELELLELLEELDEELEELEELDVLPPQAVSNRVQIKVKLTAHTEFFRCMVFS